MAEELLPWMKTPTNKKEFDELQNRMTDLAEEIYAKSQVIAASMNYRLRTPKGGSKWAERLAWARVDLRAYARAVTSPIAKSGGAAIAIGKAWRKAYATFYDVHSSSRAPAGRGGGFDFE